MRHHRPNDITDDELATGEGRRRRAAYDDFPGPGWGGGWGGPRGRGPRGRGRGRGRARRGDVRAALLALLAERPMHGYEMIRELDERTGGLWKPSPGSVYPTLQLLEEEALVTGDEVEGKRRFTLTDAGREAVAEQTGPSPWEQVTEGVDAEQLALRDGVFQVMAATRQLAQTGTAEQRRRGGEILADARRKLYGILAEDE